MTEDLINSLSVCPCCHATKTEACQRHLTRYSSRRVYVLPCNFFSTLISLFFKFSLRKFAAPHDTDMETQRSHGLLCVALRRSRETRVQQLQWQQQHPQPRRHPFGGRAHQGRLRRARPGVPAQRSCWWWVRNCRRCRGRAYRPCAISGGLALVYSVEPCGCRMRPASVAASPRRRQRTHDHSCPLDPLRNFEVCSDTNSFRANNADMMGADKQTPP